MKKFLVYLLAVVLVAAMGFSVFYLVRDNETLSITSASLYKEVNDTFSVGLNTKKLKSYTTISINYSGNVDAIEQVSKNENPAKGQISAQLKAKTGGTVRINFKTNNSKFRNLYCDIMIGDGSAENPYYISTAEQLYAIGREDKYSPDLHYEIISDINCASIGYWDPENITFSGSLKGNGHVISNVNIDSNRLGDDSNLNLGLFSKISSNAVVDNIVLENVNIELADGEDYVAGALAGENNGTISRINVRSVAIRSANRNATIGGVVGINKTEGTTHVARIDRVAASVDFRVATLNTATSEMEYSGNKGRMGGIASINEGGIIINSYSNGIVKLKSKENAQFSGIVDTNLSTDPKFGAHIKNCYSAVEAVELENASEYYVSGVLRTNNSVDRQDAFDGIVQANQIVGCYYLNTMVLAPEEGYTITPGFVDADYVVKAKSVDELKDVDHITDNYISSPVYEYVYDGEKYEKEIVEGEFTYWDFDNIWAITTNVNNQYPHLTYSNFTSADGIDEYERQVLIKNKTDLQALMTDENTDGTLYIITAEEIDMTGVEWKPLGTKEKPFNGGVTSVANTVISNLGFKADNTQGNNGDNLAGFVGVLGNKGRISNITFSGVVASKASNYTYAGAVVAMNGYFEATKLLGGEIENCVVRDSNINATVCAGGLVGFNNGFVRGCTVTGATNVETTPTAKLSYVGGLAGYNRNTIASSDTSNNIVSDRVNVITNEVAGQAGRVSMMGGLVGYNHNYLSDCVVDVNEGFGIKTVDTLGVMHTLSYRIGGAVGKNEHKATIVMCDVSMDILAPRSASGVYVGGIVGEIYGNASEYNDKDAEGNRTLSSYEGNYSVFKCYAHDFTITMEGNGAGSCLTGGIAGYVNIVNSKVSATYGKQTLGEINYREYTVNQADGMYANIVASYVKNATIGGTQTGALLGAMDSGIMLDCGAFDVVLNGASNAGFANELLKNALILRSYSVVSFESGKNYQKYSYYEKGTAADGMWGVAYCGYMQDCVVCIKAGSGMSNRPDQNTSVVAQSALVASLFTGKGWNAPAWIVSAYGDRITYWTLSGAYPVPVDVIIA